MILSYWDTFGQQALPSLETAAVADPELDAAAVAADWVVDAPSAAAAVQAGKTAVGSTM